MAVLPDKDIRRLLSLKDIGIEPCDDSQIQPASVDLTLSNEWRTYPRPNEDLIEPCQSSIYRMSPKPIDMDDAKNIETEKTIAETYLLQPHELVLCSTVEYVDIPANIQAQVHGKSSIARLGLLVHITAGFIDPGFKGKITLEACNLNNIPILLRAGKRICQLSLMQLYSWAERPYGHEKLGSHYQNQTEVTGSLYDGT